MSVVLDNVMTILADVINPEIHRSIIKLNMVSPEDITIGGSSVSVKILLITAGCLLRDTVATDVKSVLGALEGVENVTVEMDVMSNEQKKALREKLNGRRPEKEIPFAQPDSLTRVIAVTPGKGGVGRSSMTVNLAAVMMKPGLKVGVMDADIYGFSIPRTFSVVHEPQVINGMIPPPLGAQGVKVMSIDMFALGGQPVIWRGPMLYRALQQFLVDVFWGDLDVLLVDMPPGTGDAAIPIVQPLPNSQTLVVTTPQVTATEVAERTGSIASQMQQRVISVVENMSYLPQPDGPQLGPFGSGDGASVSARLNTQFGYGTPLLAQMPLNIALREGEDVGRPVTLDDGPASQTLSELAEKFSIAERGLDGRPLGVFPAQE